MNHEFRHYTTRQILAAVEEANKKMAEDLGKLRKATEADLAGQYETYLYAYGASLSPLESEYLRAPKTGEKYLAAWALGVQDGLGMKQGKKQMLTRAEFEALLPQYL